MLNLIIHVFSCRFVGQLLIMLSLFLLLIISFLFYIVKILSLDRFIDVGMLSEIVFGHGLVEISDVVKVSLPLL